MVIIGTGGHSKVICSIVKSNNDKIDAFIDEFSDKHVHENTPVIKYYNKDEFQNLKFIIAVGNNKSRFFISKKICHTFVNVIHKSSLIDPNTIIGDGTVFVHGTIVQSGSKIGSHCIVNTNASIDHDCVIDDFVHISPGSTLCGNVEVGLGTHIGAGATLIPGVKVGKWCTIGAGSVVINNIPDFSVVVGIPGKIIKYIDNEFS